MISKIKQWTLDLFAYMSGLPIVEQAREYYDSLQEKEKKLLKILALFFVLFFVYYVFSSSLSKVSELEEELSQLKIAVIELNSLNKIMLEKGKANFKMREYVSLTALLEECEKMGLFAPESRIDFRESSKDIQRGKFKEYRVWAQYRGLSLAQLVKFLACVESPTNTVKIIKFKLNKNLEQRELLDIELEAKYRLRGKK